MKSLHKIAFVMLALCLAFAFTSDADAKSRHRGRNTAIGVLGAAAALAIIANGAKADDGPRDRADFDDEDDHGYRCQRWNHRCDDGEGWACRKFANNC